jgi:hypothetical protein
MYQSPLGVGVDAAVVGAHQRHRSELVVHLVLVVDLDVDAERVTDPLVQHHTVGGVGGERGDEDILAHREAVRQGFKKINCPKSFIRK